MAKPRITNTAKQKVSIESIIITKETAEKILTEWKNLYEELPEFHDMKERKTVNSIRVLEKYFGDLEKRLKE